MPQQPKISPDQFSYKRTTPPVDFGGGQGLALPWPVLVVICLGFLGAAGFLVYKLLNMDAEKGSHSCHSARFRVVVVFFVCFFSAFVFSILFCASAHSFTLLYVLERQRQAKKASKSAKRK